MVIAGLGGEAASPPSRPGPDGQQQPALPYDESYWMSNYSILVIAGIGCKAASPPSCPGPDGHQ